MLLHLDTDLGGNPDDACALAMLLGWPDLELAAITTALDPGGRRTGCVDHVLGLAGRDEVEVVAGAAMSSTVRESADLADRDTRHWPPDLEARPASAGAALDCLERSIARGAVVAAIGPLTNLAALELLRPGALSGAEVVVMGGWVDPPAPGKPAWGPARDFNIQWDTRAASTVFAAAGTLTLVTLPGTLSAHLTDAELPALRALGHLGELLAQQGKARAEDAGMTELRRAHAGLPDDLVNFHFDPVTCAVAAGWTKVRSELTRLSPVLENDVLRFRRDAAGRQVRVITDVDGVAFADVWFTAVKEAARARGSRSARPTARSSAPTRRR